ncbi:MAG: histidine phosphatase family protein [Desulfovibrio sp.]|jgi:probable phosphoglycerate mutase|nr:histidine phosphatase family protein [Desulfovibrio sp.]
MKNLLLVRHGDLLPNPERRFIGASDVSLSDVGRARMRALSEELAWEINSGNMETPKAVCCSDLVRSRESAAILAAAIPDAPLLCFPGLREISLGRWEGRTRLEVERDFPGQYEARGRNMAAFQPEEGESFLMLRNRALAALADIRSRRSDGLVLAVGHAGLNKVLLAEYLALPLNDVLRIPQPYACRAFLPGW